MSRNELVFVNIIMKIATMLLFIISICSIVAFNFNNFDEMKWSILASFMLGSASAIISVCLSEVIKEIDDKEELVFVATELYKAGYDDGVKIDYSKTKAYVSTANERCRNSVNEVFDYDSYRK